MEKIKSITLRNFKFFYGDEISQKQNKLVLSGNHLLLYGENGSGKSSIYWALYTFLQSALKTTDEEIKKYFDPENIQNLRNRFAQNNHESAIEIEFQSNAGETTKKLRRSAEGVYELNCFNDIPVKRVLEGSDFINYKFLSKIYDFRNSEDIDLFPMFERDILMFLNFEQAYTDHSGTLSNKTYASDWWSFIENAPAYFSPNGNVARVGTEEYRRFKNTTIPRFVDLLKLFLTDITQEVNRLLKDEFQEEFIVDFDVESIFCDYNKSISQRAKDGKIHKPRIPLRVKLNHDTLSDSNKDILKPHTFLNEARLTAIALAIRLAILHQRPVLRNSARILVLDDLLLSLDMSHRDKILDILLSPDYTETYQLMILSHDKSFYNLCKKRIQDRFNEGWIFKEVYQGETETGIPCPFIPDQKNYLDLAQKYLKEFDYPASANYLRKESERVLKYLLPENLSAYTGDEGTKVLQLDSLIANFEKYYKDLGGDITYFKKLKEYKDLLLNPLSHDNIHSPIYKRELINVFEILEKLNKLVVRNLGQSDEINSAKFHLHETDTNGDTWIYDFTLKEKWRGIKGLNNNWIYSNPIIKVVSRTNTTQALPREVIVFNNASLSQVYTNIRYKLGIRVKQDNTHYLDNIKPLKEIIFKDATQFLE